MSSSRPSPVDARAALAPQRRPGRERVAALLRAAAQVIGERGFEATTMAEIAARAGSPIGSLYRFFPNKEAVADALVESYIDSIDAAFEKIDHDPQAVSNETFADALLASLTELRGEMQTAVTAFLDTRADGSYRRQTFHEKILSHIARVLRQRESELDARTAADMAVVLLQNMKAMKQLDAATNAGAIAELRTMNRLYLANKLRG